MSVPPSSASGKPPSANRGRPSSQCAGKHSRELHFPLKIPWVFTSNMHERSSRHVRRNFFIFFFKKIGDLSCFVIQLHTILFYGNECAVSGKLAFRPRLIDSDTLGRPSGIRSSNGSWRSRRRLTTTFHSACNDTNLHLMYDAWYWQCHKGPLSLNQLRISSNGLKAGIMI